VDTNSALRFEKYAKEYFRPNMRVLEIGADGFPASYKSIIDDGTITWDTLDLHQDSRLTHDVMLSTSESLELTPYRRFTPGTWPENESRRLRLTYKYLGLLGWPVERSYDTITESQESCRR
jgi:hypothetical protein